MSSFFRGLISTVLLFSGGELLDFNPLIGIVFGCIGAGMIGYMAAESSNISFYRRRGF